MIHFRAKPHIIMVVALIAALSACTPAGSGTSLSGSGEGAGTAEKVRIGYFPNLTHAPAIVGVEKDFFATPLKNTVLEPVIFSAGPSAIEALFSGAVDMIFVGPNPTINGYSKSNGDALRVVAGAASGGAGLVVRSGIETPAQLRGAKLATPQLGNTQDVALRHWLKGQGLTSNTEGGGDVSILPQDNATALQSFLSGNIDGAWLPEPWLSQLVLAGQGHLLVNESSLWPDGAFVVTNVVVRKDFLDKYPETVAAVVEGELDSIDFINAHPDEAKTVVNNGINKITGKSIDSAVLDQAWSNVKFTYDPLAPTLLAGAANAESVGLQDNVNLDGLYDFSILNSLLAAKGLSAVKTP